LSRPGAFRERYQLHIGSRRPVPRKVLDRPIAHHHSNEVLVGFFLYREHHACPNRLYQPKFPFDE
jgi:hypothetical protein